MTQAQIIDSVVLADSVLGTSFEVATLDAIEAIKNGGASRYSISNRTTNVVVAGTIVTILPPTDRALSPGNYRAHDDRRIQRHGGEMGALFRILHAGLRTKRMPAEREPTSR
jgi:hypothetical protein